MIPCFICGKDASTGWIKGFPPAPDSQKLALCRAHDSAENRLLLIEAWQNLIRDGVGVHAVVTQNKVQPKLFTLTVRFAEGGLLSFICSSCEPTAHGTLRISMPDGTLSFVPMHNVQEFSLRPVIIDELVGQAKPQPSPATNSASSAFGLHNAAAQPHITAPFFDEPALLQLASDTEEGNTGTVSPHTQSSATFGTAENAPDFVNAAPANRLSSPLTEPVLQENRRSGLLAAFLGDPADTQK